MTTTDRDSPSVRCFLVEDSTVMRESLAATLAEVGGAIAVGCAADAATALQWLCDSDESCDLLIIDVFLKRGTGLEILSRARLLRPRMKRVVLTHYATPEMKALCVEMGADRIFDRAAELDELLAYCRTLAQAS